MCAAQGSDAVEGNPDIRQGDGGVFLAVLDDTKEFQLILEYLARLAISRKAHVGILHVMQPQDFQHWGNIERRMQEEQRQEAEKILWTAAKTVHDLSGIVPVLYLEEGERSEVVVNVVNADQDIRALILGGDTSSSGPGPLVSYFTGKGMSRLGAPLIIVPDNIPEQRLDTIK